MCSARFREFFRKGGKKDIKLEMPLSHMSIFQTIKALATVDN